jgi:hypothetical protein
VFRSDVFLHDYSAFDYFVFAAYIISAIVYVLFLASGWSNARRERMRSQEAAIDRRYMEADRAAAIRRRARREHRNAPPR